jgi:glucose/arabinose dehydrogenase
LPALRSLLALACFCALGVACAADASTDEPQQAQFRLRAFATGLSEPLYVTGAKGDPGRLYVLEQGGTIRIVDRGRIRPGAFLDLSKQVTAGGEQGLLGFAVHPGWPRVRKFYVQYTDRAEDTRLVEYRANATSAIPGSARQLFFSRDPYGNHNGGMLAFAPNGRLFFTMGDGGSAGDPENRSQNPRSLFGKLLSINVATKGLKIEAYGLRNAWRFSFDRTTKDLYIADVGQGSVEEVNWTPASSPGLENYGWDVWEGRSKYEDKALGPGRLVQPVASYSHSEGCSITGGYVYRGSNAALRGRYIYGDYCSGTVWSFKLAGGRATGLRRERFKIEGLTSFGEDLGGELYGVSQRGTIYRLTP